MREHFALNGWECLHPAAGADRYRPEAQTQVRRLVDRIDSWTHATKLAGRLQHVFVLPAALNFQFITTRRCGHVAGSVGRLEFCMIVSPLVNYTHRGS